MDRGIIVQQGERKVVYDGRTWHQSKTARYFYTHVSIAGKRRHVALHKYVFEKFSGKAVSPGHDVHHTDHDYRNNLFSNLVELTKSDHLSYHGRKTWADDRERMVAATQAGRDAATVWHASEAGREWHSQHGKAVWQNRESFKVEKTCRGCGALFETYRAFAQYCSNHCWQAVRYKARKYMVVCEGCGTETRVGSKRGRFCSRSCARRHQAHVRRDAET